MRVCIRAQRFIEAEEIKNKLKEMKLEVVIKKSKEMEFRQANEIDQVLTAQDVEVTQFIEAWEGKIAEYKNEAKIAEQDMMNKHQSDLYSLEQDLRLSLPLFVRTNPKILNLKKMVEVMAKQKEFVQAEKIKSQINLLEEVELRKCEEQKEQKIMYILSQLAGKQKNEINGLKKRVSAGYASLLQARDTEKIQLEHKLQNIRKVVENNHQLELAKFEVAYRNYVPGETLRFKPRKRGPVNFQNKILPSYKNSLNNSINEGVKTRLPPSHFHKRSFTPVRKDSSHIRGHPSNNSSVNKSVLIPINQERFKSNPRERTSKDQQF